ncbi:hypothetical protein [Nocardiopsis sp. CNS-639]|uniref:hypothetical protein n=2 Tax=Nocardiopsis TaxID=2013 RepID=UPI0003AA6307|nr:hypothetical protein [Nocardiopsis sp. CNS-639]
MDPERGWRPGSWRRWGTTALTRDPAAALTRLSEDDRDALLLSARGELAYGGTALAASPWAPRTPVSGAGDPQAPSNRSV